MGGPARGWAAAAGAGWPARDPPRLLGQRLLGQRLRGEGCSRRSPAALAGHSCQANKARRRSSTLRRKRRGSGGGGKVERSRGVVGSDRNGDGSKQCPAQPASLVSDDMMMDAIYDEDS